MIDHQEKAIEKLQQEVFQLQQTLAKTVDFSKNLKETLDFSSILDHSFDLIQNIDDDGTILYVNKAWQKKIGYTNEEAKKLNVFQIIHPSSIQHCQDIFEKLLTGKIAQEIKVTFQTKSGNLVIVKGNISPIVKNEKIVSILGFFHDLTSQLNIEKKLRLSLNKSQNNLNKLNKAQKIAKIGSWEFDHASDSLTWSDEVYKIFNLNPQQFEPTFESFLNHIHPEDREMVSNAFTNSLKDKTPYKVKHRLLLKSGVVNYVEERCKTTFNTEGFPVSSLGTIMDITESKQDAKLLDYYKYALDQSAIVAITNVTGTITYVNDKFCNLSKYSRKELIGKNHEILNSGNHPKEFMKNLWRTISKGEIWRGEIKNKAKDNTLYWVDTTIIPFVNEKGKPIQYLTIRFEISEKMQLSEALNKEKELGELKSKFVTMTSHEFRTPLASIKFAAGSIRKYWEKLDDESRIKKLNKIESQVTHLTHLLDDILFIGKTESGLTAPDFQVYNFNEFIQPIIEDVSTLSKNTHEIILINKNTDINILIDPKLGRSIFTNLLNNAIKFSPLKKEVILEVNSDKKMIQIKITDFGIGIKEENLKKIFFPFHREENVEYIQGSGLGLSIVKDAISLSEGAIKVESCIDKGTIVSVKLKSSL